ncbi:MAG: DoxX family protein [Woeseiaceae bacterium]|nr:DoxX family protein [Woeseiaceae bacterium]
MILLARLCLATVFLVSGIHKGIWHDKAVQEFRDAGVPAVGFFLPLTIALHLVAPLALVLGVHVREAALALALFTVIATVKVHCFWRMEGTERLARSRIAMAHLAVVGGLIILAAVGPGKLVI